MNTQYQEVNTEDGVSNNKASVRSILKQILICSSAWTYYFAAGLCRGAPTVFVPQLRKEANSTENIDEEMISWLYSIYSISDLPFIIILPLLTKRIGRKPLQTTNFIVCLATFLILYLSRTPLHILISEVIQGYLVAFNFTISNLIVTEFASTELRGMFLTIKSTSFFWGMWAANAIGAFFHWKYIAVLGLICTISTGTSIFCPESPFWLASKGRFDDCRSAFRWIYGFTAEKDLRDLILVHQEHLNLEKEEVSFITKLRSPELYKPLFLSIVAVIQYMFSGKVICSIFILDIFKHVTSSENSAYIAMLILDGVTVFSMYIGSFLVKVLKRRTLYLPTSWLGVAFLFIISLYLFLIRLKLLSANNYISLALFTAYSLSISCGPMIFSLSIYGELISRRFQTSCYIIIGLILSLSLSSLVKFAPKMFASLGLDGTFLLYGVVCGFCTLYLHLFLPETKNKTQWEIEEYFKAKK